MRNSLIIPEIMTFYTAPSNTDFVLYVLLFSGSPLMLVLVSMLWGFTNPVLKLTSEGLEDIKESGRIRQFFAEVAFLASNAKVCYC